jgi:predicted nicotinamide N-methyase
MPGYRTKQQQVAVAGVAALTIRSLLDRQQFADPLGEAQRLGISSAAWPMFGLLWPSAAQLALLLALRPVRAGERILEIGCGLALASLVAHRRGADVTASDCHPLAGAFLRENLRLNALAPLRYRHGQWGAAGLAAGAGPGAALADAAPAQPDAAAGDAAASAAARLPADPPRVAVRGRYDLVIGSDLLYERDQPGGLAAFIGRHSAWPAEVWIVDPDRGNRPPFHRRMAALGFSLTERLLRAPGADGAADFRGRWLAYHRA